MKLVKQVSLEYREGSSDKVYEVDLCEVGAGQFVVNFRYGRRGSTLRDGSKTAVPVGEAAANRIFDDLVASKEKKGYRRPGSAPATPSTAPIVDLEFEDGELGPRREAILQILANGGEQPGVPANRQWSLSRIAWRCGELRLTEAEPLLIGLVGARDAMLDYCIAWALGQCGTSACSDLLKRLEASHDASSVRRIAGVALLEVLQGDEREAVIRECIQQLPESLRKLAADGPSDEFTNELNRVLAQGGADSSFLLEIIYLINNAHVRPALIDFLQSARLEPGCFHRVRHIFKAAELRRDAEVFGVIARRFETTPGRFTMKGRWYYPKRKLPTMGETPEQSYSQQTRRYMRRRVWRTLSRFADLEQARDYVSLAAGVLGAFTDDDALPVRQEYRYRWDHQTRRSYTDTFHFDRYWAYFAFNQILFGNSRRYVLDMGSMQAGCRTPYEPGHPVPPEREEAHPQFWDQHPSIVVDLLTVSRCEPVHQFGVKVLQGNSDFCQQLDVDSIVGLLQVPYEVTAQFAFDLAKRRYDEGSPNLVLVLALATCAFQPAREQAFDWISAAPSRFFADSEFAAGLVCGLHADARTFARNCLRNVTLTEDQSQAIIGRLVSTLHGLGDGANEIAQDVAETLLLVFGPQLRRVGEGVIRDMLDHALPELRRFAGDLILGHETFALHPPDDIIKALLESDHEAVRGIGVRIIGQLPADVLRNSSELLIGLTRHEQPDIRDAIRPTLVRLCSDDAAFGERIGQQLIEALLTPGAPEGVPSHTARVLREDLLTYLSNVSADTVWRLLQSRSAPAQEVGGALLATNINSADIPVDDIVRLGNHEILSVREACWQMCQDNVDRLKSEAESAARLADSRWEDTRQFAFGFLRDHFIEDGMFSPNVLVSICDSVKPDVQQFGRELITRLFELGHGEEYVNKLSEHPAEPMQLFASNFLEQHASGNPEQLEQLAPYFVSVLSRVNRGRVAKTRALKLLEREAKQSERSARVAADILSRISATAAITDRASAVEILLGIKTAWPTIETPLAVRPVEVRSK